jgi:hypothetical protein
MQYSPECMSILKPSKSPVEWDSKHVNRPFSRYNTVRSRPSPRAVNRFKVAPSNRMTKRKTCVSTTGN